MDLRVVLIVFYSFFCRFSETAWTGWEGDLDWWQETIIYQIYPRSFLDSNGDGVGDLKGIEERLSHLEDTGIGAYWISPIYESPMTDMGYDVSNYTRIADIFGNLEDFKRLVHKSHEKGLKVLNDFVPNHSSDECEWFKKSVERIEPYKDYYVWKDAKLLEDGTRAPPNNWLSVFGTGSAWEWNEKRGQYYLHHFNVKQPDFDYRNEKVVKEIERILLFWLDLGVDGFRLDAANALLEHAGFHDESYIDPNGPKDDYNNMYHNFTFNQPETLELVRRWRKLLDDYAAKKDGKTRLILTEAYAEAELVLLYYGTKLHPIAHIPFNFHPLAKLKNSSNAKDFNDNIHLWLDGMPEGSWPNWVIGNHDNKRVATRLGEEMVDVMAIMTMMLPGTVVTYQGEEVGQTDTQLRPDQQQDPNNNGAGTPNRDAGRGPFLWNDTKNAGVSKADKTWLPVNPAYWRMNLQEQMKPEVEPSHYKIYKQLAALKKHDTILRGTLDSYVISDWVFAFVRKWKESDIFVVVMNVGSEYEDNILITSKITDLPEIFKVEVASSNFELPPQSIVYMTEPLKLRPKSAVVLRRNLKEETFMNTR